MAERLHKFKMLKRYIITRVILTVPMVLLLMSFVFVLLRLIPGDPVTAMLGPRAPAELIQQKREELGLNKPIIVQYFNYITNVLRAEFGRSYRTNRPVMLDLFSKLPATLELAGFAMAMAISLGLFTGSYAASNQGRVGDHLVRIYAVGIFAVPIFWLGLMLQFVFGVKLGLLPTAGRLNPLIQLQEKTGFYLIDSLIGANWNAFWDALKHLILPSATLGLVVSGTISRLTRTNTLESLNQDYVVSARSRGIPERRIRYKYGLRNGFLPIITLMGLNFALMLGGAILTETTFSWPGIARYLLRSIEARDFNAIQGAIVFIALLIAVVSLVVDIIYSYLDPRVRY